MVRGRVRVRVRGRVRVTLTLTLAKGGVPLLEVVIVAREVVQLPRLDENDVGGNGVEEVLVVRHHEESQLGGSQVVLQPYDG